MYQDISSLSFTLSSKEEANQIALNFERVLEALKIEMQCQETQEKLNILDQAFCKLKNITSKNKSQLLDFHLKMLQHLEMLLLQQDYTVALEKIDQYKKYPLIQSIPSLPTSQIYHLDPSKYLDQSQILINEQIELIYEEDNSFQEKHEAWLNAMMMQQNSESEQLHHVTKEQIQQAQIENLTRELNIGQNFSEELLGHLRAITPEKSRKKCQGLRSKKKSGTILRTGQKSTEIESKKINSSYKKTEKRTARKSQLRDKQQPKTAKKDRVQIKPFII